MSKASELINTTDVVKSILKNNPEARNNDDYLFYMVCLRTNAIYMNLPFGKVLLNRKSYGFPAFETVRRTRQKIQAEHPEFAADKNVEAARMVNEEVFKDYARKVL